MQRCCRNGSFSRRRPQPVRLTHVLSRLYISTFITLLYPPGVPGHMRFAEIWAKLLYKKSQRRPVKAAGRRHADTAKGRIE